MYYYIYKVNWNSTVCISIFPLKIPSKEGKESMAMDHRIRYYLFKSLLSPKKKAAQWLQKHPMECIAWAASKARVVGYEESSDDEEGEQELQNDDGILPESEKEILRTLPLGDLLPEP